MKYLNWLIIFFSILLSGLATAKTPLETADTALRYYQSKNYAGAIAAWQELGQMGFVNANIFYNIGSAYWRMGKVGEAKRNFLQAATYQPRDPDIEFNLRFIDQNLGLQQNIPWWQRPFRRLPLYLISLNPSEGLILSALSSVLFFGLLLGARLLSKPSYKYLSLLFILPIIWTFSSLGLHLTSKFFIKKLVITSSEAKLLDMPSEAAYLQESIREGSLLRLIKDQGMYRYVKTMDGKKAWIKQNEAGEI